MSTPTQRLYSLLLLVLVIGLIALGVGALIAPGASSQGYGVPTTASTWVRATGARDLVLGLMTLALWREYPASMRLFLPIMALLPLADVLLVLAAGMPLAATLPHAVGTVGILVLAGLAWRAQPPR